MREIKFRAWSKVFNRFAPDHAEYHFDGENSHLHFDVFNGNFDTDVWDFSECEIMQYTGLKDKNGVEIYEGDILAKKSLYESQGFGVQVVEHEKTDINRCFGHGSFGDNAFSGFEISSYYGNPKELEVIGNIYENPELLRKSK